MKKIKSKNKYLSALALGILAVSGLAINVSAISDNSAIDNHYGVFKEVKNDPLGIIRAEKLLIPENVDIVEQMSHEFVKDSETSERVAYMSGDTLKELEK